MKFIITGSTGNISKPLIELLIASEHEVSVVSSNSGKISEIESLGAKPLIGSIEDTGFLTDAFKGADAVYTMVPPKMDAVNWKDYIHQIGKNYAKSIIDSDIKKVVNLSSVGAHMPEGCGPVSGLHFVEEELNKIENVDVRHLRPAYFFTNLLGNIGMIKNMGIIGSNFGGIEFPLVHPKNIAEVAFEELKTLSFSGKTIRYIAGDERTTDDVAKVIGEAIGRPDLKWIHFKDEDALGGMLQMGLPNEVAKNYVELGQAISSGESAKDYYKHKPALSAIKLEDFAKEFATAYGNN